MKTRNKGFTLTELLTTVTTIGVVASLLLPTIAKAKHKAKDVQCLNNQRNFRVNMEMVYPEMKQDYNPHPFTVEEKKELYKRLIEGYVGPFVRDPYLGDLGVLAAKGLTCPYTFGDGKTRSFFFHAQKSISQQPEASNEKESAPFFTYTYCVDDSFFPLEADPESPKSPLIWDLVNFYPEKPYEFKVEELFPRLPLRSPEDLKRVIRVDNRLLHPHKGMGVYVTFGSGEQRWLKNDKLD